MNASRLKIWLVKIANRFAGDQSIEFRPLRRFKRFVDRGNQRFKIPTRDNVVSSDGTVASNPQSIGFDPLRIPDHAEPTPGVIHGY